MTAPLNAYGQLPSGLTLAALRERAVLFGGNGCEVPAPDLLCLLDTLDEAREEAAGRDAWLTHISGERDDAVAAVAARDAELRKLADAWRDSGHVGFANGLYILLGLAPGWWAES